MPSKTKVKISRKLRKVIHNAPCSSKTLSSTRVRQDGKLSNKQKQSVTVNLAAPACQRKVRTTLQDGAFKAFNNLFVIMPTSSRKSMKCDPF
jgi:hypothetical protein